MNVHLAKHNDGTIAITNEALKPMQGTFIGEDEHGTIVVQKGIIRPPFVTMDGRTEAESACDEASFGREMLEAVSGDFYSIKETGGETSSFSLQTAYFGCSTTAKLIEEDNKRLAKMTVFDLLSKENGSKVMYGVPAGLLIEQMAPWDLIRKLDISGVRATVYGSELVPRGDSEYDGLGDALDTALAAVDLDAGWPYSHFMLSEHTARLLAKRGGVELLDLYDKWFLIHRDPALPDGTSLFLARFAGLLKIYGHYDWGGIALNPHDPLWKAAGGDFDGDAGSIYYPHEWLLPRQPVERECYKTAGLTFKSEDISEQIIEYAALKTLSLLGPIILDAMRLAERGLLTDELAALAASAAQASVQSRKHSVDEGRTVQAAEQLREIATASREESGPFVTDFLNKIRRASGLAAKAEAWEALREEAESGTWDYGAPVEQALLARIRIIDRLFQDASYFQCCRGAQLPQSMRQNAAALAEPGIASVVKELSKEYRAAAKELAEIRDAEEDKDTFLRVSESLRMCKRKFQLACRLGEIGGEVFDPTKVQVAMVAFGPAKIAATAVSAEVFKVLGAECKQIFINLAGHGWENGEYDAPVVVEYTIPGCLNDVVSFVKGKTYVNLEVVSEAKNSTRVRLF